jgi:hypothetical protein
VPAHSAATAPDPQEANTCSAATEPPLSPRPDTASARENIVGLPETSHIVFRDPAEVRRATRLAVRFNIVFLVLAILPVLFTLFELEWIFTQVGLQVSALWAYVSAVWYDKLCCLAGCRELGVL